MLTVVSPARSIALIPLTSATALRNTSGRMTAEPQFKYTPPREPRDAETK